MNIIHQFVCSAYKILKKIQYYGNVKIKPLLAIYILEDVIKFFKTDTTQDVSKKIKYVRNLQQKFIHSDENICNLQPTTDDYKDYRGPAIYDLEVTVYSKTPDYSVLFPGIKVFIATLGYEQIGAYETDAYGRVYFRNLDSTKRYYIWTETKDGYTPSGTVHQIAENTAKQKKVDYSVFINKSEEALTGNLTIGFNDNLSLPVKFCKVNYLDSSGNYNTGFTGEDGTLVLSDITSGPVIYWIDTPRGYVIFNTKTLVVVPTENANFTSTLILTRL